MELSRFNIISEIKDSNEFFILNSLYGSADIIDKETYLGLINGGLNKGEFEARGYLVDPEAETVTFRNAYLRFLDERETDEVQLFFVPGYSCNFDCPYCYQGDYKNERRIADKKVIDSFFGYVHSEFAGRRKYLTLFGGEPLLPGNKHRDITGYIIDKSVSGNLDLAVVTNGYHVADYIDILKRARLREIQVTIDGTREVHNKRRFLKNGDGTFDSIVKGIDLLVENDIPVNLRVVVDKENIRNLPELARFAIDRGWTGYQNFSTQLGRNYELYECQVKSEILYSRIELYAELYKLIQEYPHILEFHKPAFSVSRALFERGELPSPLFDSCPGTKTEWAFDFTGNIFACTATVGKKGEELGRFFPERVIYRNKLEEWKGRDILSIKECRECNLALICGGGCGSVAKRQRGSICAPDCRPVKELLGLGISAYFLNKATLET